MAIIEVKEVSKKYPARRGTKLLLGRGGLADIFTKEKSADFWALQGISLEVNAGESLGIIGRNGSGKSTLLKILAGVTLPSSGTVRIEGRVASLLELGAGFHPMLTGRENIYLNAGLLGMRAKQVTEVFDQIVEFSGIAEFIDQPVDTYSSGMYVRIAFSVAVHANPDIFLVDEVLAVGDEEFQRKCRVKIGELKEQGKTIVFVSHDLGIVHALCDRVVLLHKGAMIKRDTPQQTIDYYLRQIGRESGIHTMNTPEIDLIFNHGRLTLFKNKEELSGPAGIYVSILSIGQEHHSNYADWNVTNFGADYCTAQGRLARLPAILHMSVRLKGHCVEIEAWLECLFETPVDAVSFRFQVKGSYAKWYLEDQGFELPPIEPGNVDWSMIMRPDSHCRRVLMLDETGHFSPIQSVFTTERSHAVVQGFNCDYISGSRMLDCTTLIPADESPSPKGNIHIAKIELNLGMGLPEAKKVSSQWEERRFFNIGLC